MPSISADIYPISIEKIRVINHLPWELLEDDQKLDREKHSDQFLIFEGVEAVQFSFTNDSIEDLVEELSWFGGNHIWAPYQSTKNPKRISETALLRLKSLLGRFGGCTAPLLFPMEGETDSPVIEVNAECLLIELFQSQAVKIRKLKRFARQRDVIKFERTLRGEGWHSASYVPTPKLTAEFRNGRLEVSQNFQDVFSMCIYWLASKFNSPSMSRTCKNCHDELVTAKNSGKTWCSDRCRKAYTRKFGSKNLATNPQPASRRQSS